MNANASTHHRPATVGDLMSNDPIVVHVDDSLTDAVRLMDEYDISGLPVVTPAGALIGVISETDLVQARSSEWLWQRWPGLQVRHFMTSPPITIGCSATLEAAVRKMEEERIHRLVVVGDEDPARPIGVLSTSDVVRALARDAR